MEQENKTTQPENENTQVTETAIDVAQSLQEAHKRIVELEKELEDTKAKAESSSKYHLQYYRQAEILKKALKAIIEKHDLKMGDVYELMLESNEIDLDTLLLDLSK
jgi:hypothetical protein